jgi:hypothetical protein
VFSRLVVVGSLTKNIKNGTMEAPDPKVNQNRWRDTILKIRQDRKDKLLSPEDAWNLAMKTEQSYLQAGVPPTSDILNATLQLCHSLKQSNVIIEKFRKLGIKPSTTTYNVLISQVTYQNEAKEIYDTMIREGLRPNTYTLNGFMPFCATVLEGRIIIKEQERVLLKFPGTFIWERLYGEKMKSTML